MSKLVNVKKARLEIANLLGQDKTLLSLLLNDKPSALTDEVVQGTKVMGLNELISKNYICFSTPLESAMKDISRNTFLLILVDNMTFAQSDGVRASFVLYLSTDNSHSLMDGNRDRLLEGCDRIAEVLQDRKLSSAGQIKITSMQYVNFSTYRQGYAIYLSITDLQERQAEI